MAPDHAEEIYPSKLEETILLPPECVWMHRKGWEDGTQLVTVARYQGESQRVSGFRVVRPYKRVYSDPNHGTLLTENKLDANGRILGNVYSVEQGKILEYLCDLVDSGWQRKEMEVAAIRIDPSKEDTY